MDTFIPLLIMIGVGLFAMGQNAYYPKKIARIKIDHARELVKAESYGRLEALNDPKAVVAAYHKMFTYTMN